MTGFPFEETHRDPFCYVGVTVFRISVLVPKTYPRYLARAKKSATAQNVRPSKKGHEHDMFALSRAILNGRRRLILRRI